MWMLHPWMFFPGRLTAFLMTSILFLRSSCFFERMITSFHSFSRTGSVLPEQLFAVAGGLNPTVIVDVYVESLCIDSRSYFQEKLMPTYETLGPATMNLRVTAFGNAKIDNSTSDRVDCQHGKGGFHLSNQSKLSLHRSHIASFCSSLVLEAECDANSYEQCSADVYHNYPSRYVPFIACLFHRLKMGHADTLFSASKFAACAAATGLSWLAIKNCHNDADRSWELQKRASSETPADHTYVPWVVLNGQHVDEERDLLTEVCQLYTAAGGSHTACSSTNVVKQR